jgi:uncharacterized protein (TIGR03086 family)
VTSGNDTIGLVGRALDQMAAIISAIPASQSGLATPCPAWDARALVQHVVGQDLRNFLVSARGQTADWQAQAEELTADWAAAFQARAGRLLVVWRAADLSQLVAMPGGGQAPLRSRADQQITELTVHAWDRSRPLASRLIWTRPWPSTRSPGRSTCSGPNSADRIGRSDPRYLCRRMRRSTTGWRAGSAAIPDGRHQQATRATGGPAPHASRRPGQATCHLDGGHAGAATLGLVGLSGAPRTAGRSPRATAVVRS